MAAYSAISFYLWTISYHMPVDFDVDWRTTAAEPGIRRVRLRPGDRHRVHRRRHAPSRTRSATPRVSDGEPLTAEDVAYTFNLYKNNHAYLPQNYLTLMDGDARVVDRTVEFDTTEPTSLYGMCPLHVLLHPAEHVFEPIEEGKCPDDSDPCNPKGYGNVPSVSSGPFFIAEYKVGEFVRLERNTFWKGPEPAIDEIVYPDLQERRRDRHRAPSRGDRLRAHHHAQHLQHPQDRREHRHDGRIDPVVLRDRPEHRVGLSGRGGPFSRTATATRRSRTWSSGVRSGWRSTARPGRTGDARLRRAGDPIIPPSR